MLQDKYKIQKIKQVIKHFNTLKEEGSRLDLDLIEDIDLEPYNDFEIFVLQKEWETKNYPLSEISLIMNDSNGINNE